MALTTSDLQEIAKIWHGIPGKVWHVAKSGNDSTGDGLSWPTAYLTVFKAKSVASNGDFIRVGPGTFSEGTNRCDLSLGHSAAVHMKGAGRGVTIYDSTATSAAGPCIEVDSSIVEDLTITALLPASTLQFPIGATNSNRPFKPRIRNVEVIGLSDGFYFENNTGAGRYVRLENVRSRSNFDCLNVVDDTPGEIWEGDFKASGAFNSFSRHRAFASCGNWTIHSGNYAVVHDKPGAVYGAVIEAGSASDSDTAEITVMSGVHLSATCPGGVNAFDLVVNHYAGGPQAKIYIGDVVGSGVNGWVTNGGAGYSDEDTGSVVYRTSSLKAASISYAGIVQMATPTTVTLGAGASPVTDRYKGQTFKTTGNTGTGQAIVISGYNGSTKVATLGRPFTTTPDVTTNYVIETTDVPAVNANLQVSAGVGTGTIPVTQNQGGTDYLKPKINKVGQPNVTVSAYLQSDWDAGNRAIGYVKDQVITNSSGDWPSVMMLAAGTYAFAFNDNRDFYPAITGVVVA